MEAKYHTINQKILSKARKKIIIFFLGIKCCIKPGEWYINKPLSKNLQNIYRNKTVKFGVCEFYQSGEKTHFEKTAFKYISVTYCNENPQMIKCNKINTMYFRYFLSASLKQHVTKSQIAQNLKIGQCMERKNRKKQKKTIIYYNTIIYI